MTAASVYIHEIFVSIQGEGRYIGQPSIFVRMSGCNLRCKWGDTPCDTAYTSWEATGEMLDIATVMARVSELHNDHSHVDHLVITGGEPMLQPKLPILVEAIQAAGFFVTIETNGTRYVELGAEFISLSPKLGTSTPVGTNFEQRHEAERYNPEVLRQWLASNDCQLKFVVDSADDEREIVAILAELGVRDPGRVYLMPQGVCIEQLGATARICVDLCISHGWHYTPRAHIEIYGNTPGT